MKIDFISYVIKDSPSEHHEYNHKDKNRTYTNGIPGIVLLGPYRESLADRPYRESTGDNDTENFKYPIESITLFLRHWRSPLPLSQARVPPEYDGHITLPS